MADNLKAVGAAAGLSPEEQKQIDDFNKALAAHKELSNLPQNVAGQVYSKYTPAQQADLQKKFGNEDPQVKQKRGWLGTAWHYTGGAAGNAIGYAGSHLLAGLNNVSDLTTRLYRTAAIAVDQDVALFGQGNAWDIANDKGDKVFSPGRILDAKVKFGQDAVDIAMRIAAGEDPGAIMKSATPEQTKYLMLADPNQTQIPGYANPEEVAAARANFQDTLDAVNASKYSPGRLVANAILPANLEGSGFFYKAISGAVDAAWRVKADPLLGAAKVKKIWDIRNYALDVVVGKGKVADVFAEPQVINFWNSYGKELANLNKAIADNSPEAALIAKKKMSILAPELGPAVVNSLRKAEVPVIDSKSAQAFFENTNQVGDMMRGQVGRHRVIIPRLDPARRLRIASVSTANKVLRIDAIGPKFVDDYFFGGSSTTDGIVEKVINGQKVIVDTIKGDGTGKGVARMPMSAIQSRIDKFKAKFATAPLFKNDVLDVTDANAPEQMYRLARLVLPQRESRLISEAFSQVDEVGKKKEMFYGLWETIADIRGLNATENGQKIVRQLRGKGQAKFSLADDGFQDVGALPSDMSPMVTSPSLQDLDRAAFRSTWIQKTFGIANKDWVNKMTGYWSFLTLAGPRYALRNAGEDLMVNLAIGESPWGIAKARMLSTRLNTVIGAGKGGTKAEQWVENPLGSIMRFVNKNDAQKYTAEIAVLDTKIAATRTEITALKKSLKETEDITKKAEIQTQIDDLVKEVHGGVVGQTRQIFARALTEGRVNRLLGKLGRGPLNQKEAELLSEQLIHGDIENALSIVSEGGFNFATGNDYISRAVDLVKSTGVSAHELTLNLPKAKYAKKQGEIGFSAQAVSKQDEASLVGWMLRIGYYSNDELGGIAVAGMGVRKESDVLKDMANWITDTKQGQKFYKDSRLDLTPDSIAKIAFNRAKENFVKKDGTTLNLDLLSKIRTQDEAGNWVVTGKLSLDDVASLDEFDIPAAIIGPTLVPAVDASQYTTTLMTNGWTWLGMANSRMSREPLVLNEMITIRKQMRETGFEQAWIDAYVKDVVMPISKTAKLPQGLKFDYLDANNSLETKLLLKNEYGINTQQANQALNSHTIIAKDKNGNYVGHISWNKDTGKIQLVNVSSEMQRKGVATELFNQAREVKGNVVKPIHETVAKNLSPEGAAWKKAIESGKAQATDEVYIKKVAQATLKAKRELASVVEDRAVAQSLAYIDNPLVRSQIAFSARNFARFYRATEDFYRRMYRAVRFNPEAVQRAALTYEGVTHSGFIQKDDQGQPYFVYPGIAPVYNAVQGVLDRMGIGNQFKVPFPVEFGAQLKMITPSLNPDSLVPTFSGPLAGASVTTISSLVGIFDQGAADTIKGYALGKYAVDQPVLSALMPAHINRLIGAMDQDERNSQYASAWRKAVTYLEASGHGLPKKYNEDGTLIPPSAQDLEDYRLSVKNTTLGILRVRFALGFFAPASPSVQLKSDMSQWISDNGAANWKQAWIKLLDQYPGDYDAAMAKWVELYPNEVPYTLSESEKKSVAPLRYAEEAGYFVDQNKGLFDSYPGAAAFLIPHKTGFSWDAYKTMKDMGLMQNKRVDEYLREVQTAADLQQYYTRKNQFEESLSTAGADYDRTQLRREFDSWKQVFFAGRPLVQEELSQGSQKAIERQRTLAELETMLNKNPGVRPKTESKLREMISLYNQYKDERANYDTYGGSQQLAKMLKDDTIARLREMAKYNENTQAAYDVLFGRLLGD
jgi:HAMP domain-containing protein